MNNIRNMTAGCLHIYTMYTNGILSSDIHFGMCALCLVSIDMESAPVNVKDLWQAIVGSCLTATPEALKLSPVNPALGCCIRSGWSELLSGMLHALNLAAYTTFDSELFVTVLLHSTDLISFNNMTTHHEISDALRP
eukprot:TRINITY_DN4388_c0_g1_i1.p1 TRINITY_DN4388_c0_g1~~TRINITY_DN4388_c0_g1_i1.p1  ORF type:complete len:137 (-),score=3.88 TRINITY_DN4388_c0_g1_i1:135-545(-)